MRLVYIGPHDRIRVPLPGGREVEADRFTEIDVPAGVANGLLEQPSNFRRPPRAAEKKSSSTDTKED